MAQPARPRLHRLQEPLRVRRQQAAVRARGDARRRAGMAALYAAHRRIHGRRSRSARRISGARCVTPIWTRGAMPMRKGLVMKGPRRIYDAFYSSAGMLFAQRHGFFRPYHDTVFRQFWSHELEIDDLAGITDVITSRAAARPASSKPMSTALPAPSTTASSTRPKRSACSACRPWCSTASCSGAAIASTC